MTRFAPAFFLVAGLALSVPGRTTLSRVPSAAPRKTVAVLYFDNYTGRSDYDPIGKGLASMMITDLSSVQEIQLVERDRLQDLVKEMDAQHTKYFDSTTAVKVGRIAGAQFVVTGAMQAVQPKVRLDTRVIKVETGEIVKTAQVTGQEDQFFDLQQELAHRLIDGLAIALSPEEQEQLRKKQEADRINALSTMAGFSQAIASYDRGDWVGAVQRMQPVMQASPNSMLLQVTYDEMKRRAAEKATDKLKDGVGRIFRRP